MTGISWSPMMLRPLESLWSALNRTLYLDVAPSREPFKAWRLNRRIMSRHSLFFIQLSPPSYRMPPYIATIARRLQLSDEQLAQGVLPLRDFPTPDNGLRYCPRCMEVSFHCVLFQLTALACCPIHGERLLDRCRHCGMEIDGRLSRPERALSCQACGRALVKDYEAAMSTASPGDVAPLHAIWTWVARGHPAALAEHWRILPCASRSDPSDAVSVMVCLDKGTAPPPRSLKPPGMVICYRARTPLPWSGSGVDIFEMMLRSAAAPETAPIDDPAGWILQITRSWLRHKLGQFAACPSSRVRGLRHALAPGAVIPSPKNSAEKERLVTLIAVSLLRRFVVESLMPAAADWASPPSVVERTRMQGITPGPFRMWREWTFLHRIGSLILALDVEAVLLARQFVAIGVWLHRPKMEGRLSPVLETVYNERDSTRYIAWHSVRRLDARYETRAGSERLYPKRI